MSFNDVVWFGGAQRCGGEVPEYPDRVGWRCDLLKGHAGHCRNDEAMFQHRGGRCPDDCPARTTPPPA